MDAPALRALQAPLKERYKSDPKTAVITLKAVATAIEVPLQSGTVSAEGDLDFRGTLGVDRAAPVGFRDIRLSFTLDTDEPEDRRQNLLRLTERYCVVLQTLRAPPNLSASLTTG